MSDIHVRKMSFEWPEDLPLLARPNDVASSCELVGFSMTMPHLEPYLIRTMRVAAKDATDPRIVADMKNFSGQEAQHHRNHSMVNKIVRAKMSPEVAQEVLDIEAELEADYQRYTAEGDLKFNLAYAEGFEALTLAMALSTFEKPVEGTDPEWSRLMEWHLAEEVEHRTVTFDAYDHIYGDYLYRLRKGVWAQKHFMGYVMRLARAIAKDFADPDEETESGPVELGRVLRKQWSSGLLPRYLKTLSPTYNPAKVEVPEGIRQMWAQYDEMALSRT